MSTLDLRRSRPGLPILLATGCLLDQAKSLHHFLQRCVFMVFGIAIAIPLFRIKEDPLNKKESPLV